MGIRIVVEHPKYRYCEGGNGYSDWSRTKSFFIKVTKKHFFLKRGKNRYRQIRAARVPIHFVARQPGSPYILLWQITSGVM